jgi:hypothetical protein
VHAQLDLNSVYAYLLLPNPSNMSARSNLVDFTALKISGDMHNPHSCSLHNSLNYCITRKSKYFLGNILLDISNV